MPPSVNVLSLVMLELHNFSLYRHIGGQREHSPTSIDSFSRNTGDDPVSDQQTGLKALALNFAEESSRTKFISPGIKPPGDSLRIAVP